MLLLNYVVLCIWISVIIVTLLLCLLRDCGLFVCQDLYIVFVCHFRRGSGHLQDTGKDGSITCEMILAHAVMQ